jgi:ABC-type multidrug transport system ATPase subunit
MSVVAQQTCLFSTTIRENIVYGLPREAREAITDVEIEKALKQANAWNFVNDFPRKLETYAGERGVKLSGGQKQRLAIARAIIRKPTLIFLDEATSALDSKAEVVVQEALDKMVEEQKNGCTLIIAHRLSTLRSCDRIIVMYKGSIKECGSHAQLMDIPVTKNANGDMITGWYRDLYETQHGKSGDSAAEVEAVKAELESMKRQLVEMQQENVRLRDDTLKRLKNGSSKHNSILETIPPKLELLRACSGSVVIDENQPPPALELQRARTTM